MIGRNFIVKNEKKISEHKLMQNNLLKNSLPLGAVHKERLHKIEKIDLPPFPPCPQNIRTVSTPLSPLSVRTHHKFQKIRIFLHQKVRTSASEDSPCPQNVCTGQIPFPLSAGVLYEPPTPENP